ncbi:MAG TPA: glycosyltransferase [Elusimicrobiota bacterium]|jgi:GT2 family glycosyltransferase|nr:glycosyltransferase [Elusimicrobiota bacterium]
MRVSIVIPTFRRRRLLERCLSACLTQTLPEEVYEIVVCDDAGEGDLPFAVRKAGERFGRFDLRCLRPGESRGPAAARNRGWRAASGEIIAFTDDDCIPAFDWLEEGLRAMEGLDAAQGRIVVPLARRRPRDYELNVARMEGAQCATANFFCRREALERVGGFDERFRTAWREDSDLYFSLLERGLRVGRAHGAVVVHPVRPAPWGAGLRLQRNNFYDALLFKKHPALYREWIGGPPWDYYLAVLCLAAGGLGWLRGVPGLRWGAALWALWTAAFCLRRLAPTSKAPSHVLEMAWTSAAIPFCSVFWRLRGAAGFRTVFF